MAKENNSSSQGQQTAYKHAQHHSSSSAGYTLATSYYTHHVEQLLTVALQYYNSTNVHTANSRRSRRLL